MVYAYIGNTTKIQADKIAAKYPLVVVVGEYPDGTAELAVATENERIIAMFQSAMERGTLYV